MLKRALLTAIMSLFLGFMPVALLTTPSHAELLQNQFLPVDSLLSNPCTGEDVHVTGEAHILEAFTENDNNRIGVFLSGLSATGVGVTTGDTYQVKFVGLADPFKISSQNEQEQHQNTSTLKIIGLGGTSTLIALFVNHETVDADGDLTVLFEIQSTKCV
jgi:hypothetical protein